MKRTIEGLVVALLIAGVAVLMPPVVFS